MLICGYKDKHLDCSVVRAYASLVKRQFWVSSRIPDFMSPGQLASFPG